MLYDNLGLPKENGASDKQDSARFAGILSLFWKEFDQRLTRLYVVADPFKNQFIYVRHPSELVYDFSRDQYICLAAGLSISNPERVNEKFITGRDILTPAVGGHTKRCRGEKANWLQNLWLKADILFHAYATPTDEPNQLICMAWIAGPEYLRLWTSNNKKWEESIRSYWCGWRDEPGLAEAMIKKIRERAAL